MLLCQPVEVAVETAYLLWKVIAAPIGVVAGNVVVQVADEVDYSDCCSTILFIARESPLPL